MKTRLIGIMPDGQWVATDCDTIADAKRRIPSGTLFLQPARCGVIVGHEADAPYHWIIIAGDEEPESQLEEP